jgi:hypothetical protein
MTISHSLSQATRRPYWLLLALALFLSGQIASAEHWHNASSEAVDYDCALCVLSGVNGAAIVSSAWQAQGVPLFVFISVYFFFFTRRSVVRFNDSRAPPFYS